MQDFSSLRVELLKYGFYPFVFLECECPDPGAFALAKRRTFRSAIA